MSSKWCRLPVSKMSFQNLCISLFNIAGYSVLVYILETSSCCLSAQIGFIYNWLEFCPTFILVFFKCVGLFPFSSHHQGSPYLNGSSGFNIAAAIDPTYQRRHPEASKFPPNETQVKSMIPFTRSLPQAGESINEFFEGCLRMPLFRVSGWYKIHHKEVNKVHRGQ